MDRFLIFWILYFAAIICAQPFSDSEQVILSTYHETADDNNDIRNGDPFVFLISIDGLRYDYIQNSDRFNIKIPNLKKLISHGSFAEMQSVYPALTFPAHTTMITGVWPSSHGVLANERFDPKMEGRGLFLFSDEVNRDSLFDAAKFNNISSSAITWPVTALSQSIDYSLPDAPSRTPAEFEYYYKTCIKSGLFKNIIDKPEKMRLINDSLRVQLFESLLLDLESMPRLNALHLIDFDHAEHVYGAYSSEAIQALEEEDRRLGYVLDVLEKKGIDDRSYVFVVSDHGFTNITHVINPNILLRASNLLWDGKIWKAAPHIAPGVFAIYINDELDGDSRKFAEQEVSQIVNFLSNNHGKYGIENAVIGYENVEKKNYGGFAGAFAIMESKLGYWFNAKSDGLLVQDVLTPGYLGTHGYNPSHQEMRALFIGAGPDIKRGRKLQMIKMVDLAPTISQIMGLGMTGMEGRVLSELFIA